MWFSKFSPAAFLLATQDLSFFHCRAIHGTGAFLINSQLEMNLLVMSDTAQNNVFFKLMVPISNLLGWGVAGILQWANTEEVGII